MEILTFLKKKVRIIPACFLLVVSMLVRPASFCAENIRSPSENEIMAAFLYNFTKYIEWPPDSFPDVSSNFSICILGEDSFGSIIDPLREKTVNNRRISLKRIKNAVDSPGCNVLFISSSEMNRLAEIIAFTGQRNILTVSDMERFARNGGIINFYIKNNKVKFRINIDAARRANLKISSYLLELAEIIREK